MPGNSNVLRRCRSGHSAELLLPAGARSNLSRVSPEPSEQTAEESPERAFRSGVVTMSRLLHALTQPSHNDPEVMTSQSTAPA